MAVAITDSSQPRAIQPPEMGRVVAVPQVGGLHHRYETTSRLNSPKLGSPAADSGLDIYAEPRSTALLLAVRTAANLETRHAYLQKTAHSRADGVFVSTVVRMTWRSLQSLRM